MKQKINERALGDDKYNGIPRIKGHLKKIHIENFYAGLCDKLVSYLIS